MGFACPPWRHFHDTGKPCGDVNHDRWQENCADGNPTKRRSHLLVAVAAGWLLVARGCWQPMAVGWLPIACGYWFWYWLPRPPSNWRMPRAKGARRPATGNQQMRPAQGNGQLAISNRQLGNRQMQPAVTGSGVCSSPKYAEAPLRR